MEDLSRILEEREKELEQATVAFNTATSKIKDLRQRVRTREATVGDVVDDFVLVWHQGNMEERVYWRLFYQALKDLAVPGTPLLVEHSGREPRLFSHSFGGESTYRSQLFVTLSAGILTAPLEFQVEKGFVDFPVQPHLKKDFLGKTERRDGPIYVSAGAFQQYGTPLSNICVREGSFGSVPYEQTLQITFGERVTVATAVEGRLLADPAFFQQGRRLGPYDATQGKLLLTQKV